MDYWNDILTEKSWNTLKELQGFDFILIGGWAAYLWTGLHKSKDIDIIVDFKAIEYLKKNYDLKKNDSLKKYEIQIAEIDIDIYVPYYSKLALPIEKIMKHVSKVQGFSVVRPEVLLVLKQGAELDRSESVKGEKDRIDIITILFNVELDFKLYRSIATPEYRQRLKQIVSGYSETKYIGLTPRELKLKKKEVLQKI